MRIPGRNAHRSRSSPVICRASSRVGARITASVSSLPRSMCSTIGMPNAKVFPVPVGALAITSFHSRMGGIQPACTGVLSSIFFFCSARMISGSKPSVSKRTPCVNSILFSSVCLFICD